MTGKNFRFWLKKTRSVFLILFAAQLVYIILLKWVDPPITITQLSNWMSGYGLKRDYVDIEDMSPNVRLAVMASEDQLFPDHNGFDMTSIKQAWMDRSKKHKRVRGASTISQQVAKNVFLWQGGSWVRKGLEAYTTFMIELISVPDKVFRCLSIEQHRIMVRSFDGQAAHWSTYGSLYGSQSHVKVCGRTCRN